MNRKKLSNNKLHLLILVILIVSISILFINERWVKDAFLNNLLMALAISGITTGTLTIFSSLFEKENVMELLQTNFSVLKKCNKYGLKDIEEDFPFKDERIKDDFINSETVYILMNDGKNFISSNNEMINSRFQQKEKTTNIILLDYKQEDTMAVLTRKNGHNSTPDYYKDKIKEVINYHFKGRVSNCSHTLNIFLNSNYNTLAMIVSDNYAMISLFRVSSGKDKVPHLVFDKSGEEYKRIKDDIVRVCENSKKEAI